MSLDAQGRLVTAGGDFVQGWTADAFGVVDSNNVVGQISVPIGTTAPPVATSTIDLAGNLPADAQIGDSFVSGVQVFNSLGDTEMLSLNFEKTAANEWTVTAADGSGTAVALTDNVLTFNANGQLATPADGGIDLAAGAIPGFDAMTVNINSGIGNVTQFGELSTLAVADQNGYGAGILQSISMSQEGMLLGSFSTGVNRPLAQLEIANFTNPEGLEKTGSSMFSATINSGEPQLSVAGNGGRGLISSGTLEMSNVDLAEEFVTLITAQRGFQANSRVVTSSDEVLNDIVNLKR